MAMPSTDSDELAKFGYKQELDRWPGRGRGSRHNLKHRIKIKHKCDNSMPVIERLFEYRIVVGAIVYRSLHHDPNVLLRFEVIPCGSSEP
jgi:hypothetical protein